MKKIAVLLVAVLLCQMTTPAVSANTSLEDELFVIATPEQFDCLFNSAGDANAYGLSSSSGTNEGSTDISYSYEFKVREDNAEKADVTLDFDIHVGSSTYPFCLVGTVDSYELSWGDVLWEGPIYGINIINGRECVVIASFSKLSSSQKAQISVTIQSKTGMDDFSPVAFTFGDAVMSLEITEDLNKYSTDNYEVSSNMDAKVVIQDAGAEVNAVDSRYELIPYSTKYSFYNQCSGLEDVIGYAHMSKALYYQDAARTAITVTTNSSKLAQYYVGAYKNTLGYYGHQTSIRNIRIELSWYEYSFGNNLTYIVGMQSFSEKDFYNSGSTVLIKAFFNDAMDILGVSTETLSALFGEGVDGVLESEMSCDCGWDKGYVDVTFGMFDYANFDSSDPSLAVIFQLGTASSGSMVNGIYKYQNSVTYQTIIYTNTESLMPVANVYYNNTPDTSYIFNIIMP